MGILLIGSPAVHVQLHGGERFPLEIADVHQRVLSAENAVHVRTDIGLPGKAGADVGGNMETDILPDAARLVARPNAGIPLGSGPAVQGNNERAAVIPVVSHDLGYVRNTVQTEGIARAYPGDVRLQHAHSGVPHFLHDIALEQSADFRLGMQVGLGPQTDFHAVFPGVVRQALQIRNIAVQGIRLAVPGSVAVVRQKPSQRHVMGLVTVHDGAAGKLVIIQFPVQGFLNASVILLAVPFPVLKQDAFFIFLPVIPVIGVQVALVKGELGQQNGSAGKLVEIPQKADRPVADHEKDIQIIFIMREVHQILFPGTEIILPFLEGMPHDAVPAGGPVKGSGGSHAAIRPAVLVFYGNDLSLVGKTAVLYAAAVKIFVRLRLQGKAGFALSKKHGGRLLHHHGMILQIDHLEKRGLFIYLNPDLPRSDDNRIALLVHIQPGNRPPGTVRQNAGFRFRLGISDNTASVIPENPKNIVSVKIERHPAVVVKQHFHGGRIDFSGAFNGLGLLLRNRFFRCGKREAREGNGQSESQQDGLPEHAMVY